MSESAPVEHLRWLASLDGALVAIGYVEVDDGLRSAVLRRRAAGDWDEIPLPDDARPAQVAVQDDVLWVVARDPSGTASLLRGVAP